MGERHDHTEITDDDKSLSDPMSDEELDELERQTTPSSTSPKLVKTPLREGRKLIARSVSVNKTPPRSGRGVAHVVGKGHATVRSKALVKKEGGTARSGELVKPIIESSPPNLLPGYTDTSDEDEANEDNTPDSTPETEHVTPIKKSAGPGPTVLKMSTKINKLAESAFEVAELWEGFLARHTPQEENSLMKVRKVMDKIAGKRKAVGGGDNGGRRKKAKREASK